MMTLDRTASLPDRAPFAFRHGAFDVTVLSDGHFALPAEIVAPEATPEEWRDIERRLCGSAGTIRANANIPLIRSGEDLILIDLGGGGKFQPTEGRLAQSLQAAGFDNRAITKVLLTHAHPDHVWGMLGPDGKPRFPNATYYVGASEWDFWMDPDYASSIPPVLHDFARGAQRDLAAVRDRIVPVRNGDEIMPGLQVIATPGHTPGHLSYAFAGPETMVVSGDVVTNQIVSFEHPAWRFGNDTDQDMGSATRQRFVDRAAADRLLLLGYHFTYPGLGRVERYGNAYRYVPASS
ncbi:MBL fold metallo-hydrolase [Microvirga sp. VF16]|uniref:MBL fold metallo-hydrolase n=1 Tax=Microvirga sp. VF16 TaxID=2807101 RepID=UPI00193E6716|nr:MBL fold metallo-hydrolase [Microvirga sp. VF16]QRM31419.1 MBL fold metallo-hydrolase [Microvirga sp. VF16]